MPFPQRLSRRKLLKSGAGAVLAGAMPLPFWVRAAHGGCEARRLNVAAIGVGNRGSDNLIELQSENVVALCDVDARYLDAAKQRFPQARAYDDYRRLLSDEELDAVVVSTPDHSHALPAVLALHRGCHVYCEKPLAHDLYETQLLVRTAQESTAVTQMANQHRASWGYQRAREFLHAGVLGKVLAIHAWTLRPLWPQGIERPNEEPPIPEHLNWDLWLGPAPQRPFHSAYHPIAWRGWLDFGTGALGDLGTHLLDPILGGLELGRPSSVRAQSSGFNGETFPEWSILRFNFPRGEGAELVELTWYDGGKQPPRDVTGADRLPDDGALVIGERGKLFIPTLGKTPRLMPPALEQEVPPPAPRSAATGHITQWLTAIKRQQPELCDTPFSAGAQLTDVCLLGNLAVASDKPIDVKQALASAAPRHYRDGWSPVRSG